MRAGIDSLPFLRSEFPLRGKKIPEIEIIILKKYSNVSNSRQQYY